MAFQLGQSQVGNSNALRSTASITVTAPSQYLGSCDRHCTHPTQRSMSSTPRETLCFFTLDLCVLFSGCFPFLVIYQSRRLASKVSVTEPRGLGTEVSRNLAALMGRQTRTIKSRRAVRLVLSDFLASFGHDGGKGLR